MPVDPEEVNIVRNEKGQFAPGTKAGGRPKGAVTGIRALREFMGDQLLDLCREDGELEALMQKVKESPNALYKFLREVALPLAKLESREDNPTKVTLQQPVQIVVYQETPPQNVLESSNGNGIASHDD